jgi:hypothetical protein
MAGQHLDFGGTLTALMSLIGDRVQVLVQHGDARFVIASIMGTLSSADALGEGDDESVTFFIVDGSVAEDTYGTFSLVQDEFTGAHRIDAPDGTGVLVTFGSVVVDVRPEPGQTTA